MQNKRYSTSIIQDIQFLLCYLTRVSKYVFLMFLERLKCKFFLRRQPWASLRKALISTTKLCPIPPLPPPPSISPPPSPHPHLPTPNPKHTPTKHTPHFRQYLAAFTLKRFSLLFNIVNRMKFICNFSVKRFNSIQDGLFRGCSRTGGSLFGPPP